MRHAVAEKKKIKVLIVDDSKVTRAVIAKILREASPLIAIAGYAEDGSSALKALDVCDPDVIILDLAMPSMDGFTALPLIFSKKPRARVIICSSLSSPGAEISVRALALGATDCIPKPLGSKNSRALADFEVALKQAVLGLYDAPAAPVPEKASSKPLPLQGFRPKIIAIGSSTGGPNALMALLKDMGPVPVPVVITQHMIDKFTAILARQIKTETGFDCVEVAEDMVLEAGKIYIAAGGSHMLLQGSTRRTNIHLDDGPPENFCKPAVDVMLRSATLVYGADVMAVILTGMGRDGLRGCDTVFRAGGRIIVQDQESSIVWGMPGSVASAGLASSVLPVSGLARVIRDSFKDLPPKGDA